MNQTALRRKVHIFGLRVRELRMIAWGVIHKRHPIDVHLIPIRRCNLTCAYCNEYDDFSKPVPLPELKKRVDKLAELGVTIITISGGEPLLHPELDQLIRHIRRRGIIAGLITNGYLLVAARIQELNRAGLDHLQISIDNVMPDDTSKKSLKVLDQKLRLLAEHAEFAVNINSVLGSAVQNPEDAITVARRAKELGFSTTVGIIHDHSGQLMPLGEEQRKIFDRVRDLGKHSYSRFYQIFQDNIARGQENNWRCRAGSRYLYICEEGLVHYCSQQRGYPAIPLAEYTQQHLDHEYLTEKSCAPRCTVSCVQVIGMFDNWRAPQTRKAFAQPPLAQIESTSLAGKN
ncbi:MAG TPA: radical SAM protein [Terriglobia bacterium]|nr:radical SAM protein [Terriglobia bacterium]